MTERNIINTVLSDLNEDDVFYDIGANVGVYSGLVGDALPAGNIVAFEPHSKNVQRLKANLSHNDVSAHVFERALSNEEGTVSLSVAVESHTVSPGHNLVELNSEVEAYGDAGSERIAVDTIRGDDLISQEGLPEPTVLKVDVEGAEFDVLAGLQQHLSSDNCRLVYCEVHQDHLPRFGASESELHNLLLNAGFTINKLADHGDKYHLRAKK